MRLRQRSPEDREVLGVDEDEPPVDSPVAADNAVSENELLVQSKVGGPMRDEGIELNERVLVEEQLEPFACRQLVPLVLLRYPLSAAAQLRLVTELSEVRELIGRRHERPPR